MYRFPNTAASSTARGPVLLDRNILALALKNNPRAQDVIRLILHTVTGEELPSFRFFSLDTAVDAIAIDSRKRVFGLEILPQPISMAGASTTRLPLPAISIRFTSACFLYLSATPGPGFLCDRMADQTVVTADGTRYPARILRIQVCPGGTYPSGDLHFLMEDLQQSDPDAMHFSLLRDALRRGLKALYRI